MKFKKNITVTYIPITILASLLISACSSSENASVRKSGAQIWGQSCVRCHNAPSPTTFSDMQWETIGQHMRIRANLTSKQAEKVVEFLKMAN